LGIADGDPGKAIALGGTLGSLLGHRYSLHNIVLIVSQRPDATRVAGFHTWKQLGRKVKKGAKGIMILTAIHGFRTER
jgi:hypothetical protein